VAAACREIADTNPDIQIALKENAAEPDILSLKQQLESQPATRSVRYISKDEATQLYGHENPNPTALLMVKAKDSDNLGSFDAFLSTDAAKALVGSHDDINKHEQKERCEK